MSKIPKAVRKEFKIQRNDSFRNSSRSRKSIRRNAPRSLHRKTNTNSKEFHTLHSVKLEPKANTYARLMSGNLFEIATDSDIIQFCDHVVPEITDELGNDLNRFKGLTTVEAYDIIRKRLNELYGNTYDLKVVKEFNRYHIDLVNEWDPEQFYIISISDTLKDIGKSKNLKKLFYHCMFIMETMKVSNCFDGYFEEMEDQNIETVISEEENYLIELEKENSKNIEQIKELKFEINRYKEELKFIQVDFEKERELYNQCRRLDIKKLFRNTKVRTLKQKKILDWCKDVYEFNKEYPAFDLSYYDNPLEIDDNDGRMHIFSYVRFFWSVHEDEHLYGAARMLEEGANNGGIQPFRVISMLSKENKEATFEDNFNEFLTLMQSI